MGNTLKYGCISQEILGCTTSCFEYCVCQMNVKRCTVKTAEPSF